MTPEERAQCAWIAFTDVELAGEPNQIQKAFNTVVVAAIREAVAEEREAKEHAKQAEIDARTIATTRREWFNWMDFHGGKEFTSARSRVRKAIRDATGHLVSVTFTPGEWAKLQNGGAK